MLGDVFLEVVRLIGKGYPEPGAGFDVNVVVTDAVTDQQSALGQLRQDRLGHLDHVDDDDVGVGDLLDELGFGLELELMRLEVHTGFDELLGLPCEAAFDVVGHDDLQSLGHDCLQNPNPVNITTETQRHREETSIKDQANLFAVSLLISPFSIPLCVSVPLWLNFMK